MPRRFRFDYKSPVVNPDEYFACSGETDRIICLSLRDIHLINSYLWPFTGWPTRFSRPVGVGVREESTDIELATLQEDLSDLSARIGEATMGNCFDGMALIADAIKTLASASISASASASCCSSGSGGAGQHSPPYNPTEVLEPGTGDPPEGFESWGQFTANKCAVATSIVSNLILSWGRMSVINLAGMTLVSLIPVIIGLLADPVPGDEIAIIAGVLLTTLGLGTVLIDKVIDTLNNHTSELICVLYNSTSAQNATSEFTVAFGEFWTSDGNDSLMGYSARTAIAAMVGSSVTNRLFTLDPNITLPEGDCSDCDPSGEDPGLEWNLGSGDLACDGSERVLSSEFSGTSYYIRWTNPSDCVEYKIEFVSVSTIANSSELDVHNCSNVLQWVAPSEIGTLVGPEWVVYGNYSDFPGMVSFGSSVPFTVTVILSTL